MHSCEEPAGWQSAISCKSVSHTGAGRHDGGGRKEQTDEWEQKQADGASVTVRSVEEDLEERPGGGVDDVL